MERRRSEETGPPGFTPELGARIALLYELAGGRKAAAEIAGVSTEQLRKWRIGEARMPFYAAERLAAAAGLSLDWLASGVGPQGRSGAAAPGLDDAAGRFEAADERLVYIPHCDLETCAGHGTLAGTEAMARYAAFREAFVRHTLRAEAKDLVMVTAAGDAMAPTINPGDLLLVDRSIDRIVQDAIYVLVKRGTLVVNRVQRLFSGALAVKSDNPAYVAETLPPTEAERLAVAGRVRWIGRLL